MDSKLEGTASCRAHWLDSQNPVRKEHETWAFQGHRLQMLVAKALLPPTALSGENVHLLKVHALSHHQEEGSPRVKRAQGTLGAPLVKLEGPDTGHDGNPRSQPGVRAGARARGAHACAWRPPCRGVQWQQGSTYPELGPRLAARGVSKGSLIFVAI